MASDRMKTTFGSLDLRTPLIAASGTVGSVWEWADVADVSFYGAAVAKSVSAEPWAGRPEPRVAPAGPGMLNGIGIQNPGISGWLETVGPRLGSIDVPVWGSAVGETPEEFASVAKGLATAGVSAVELNLSCPNLDGDLFALDPVRSAEVVELVANGLDVPIGAKLSPNAEDIVSVAGACIDAGADYLTLTNTAWGFGVDIDTGTPSLSGGVGGYSGPGLKAISLRCVYQVARSFPTVPIVGCGGVTSGRDVVEYLMAGATAVGLGTVHFAEPRAGKRILREFRSSLRRLGEADPSAVVGRAL
jgi:dihydroorotate dehydrogenase (NAD+) catalytic subunit